MVANFVNITQCINHEFGAVGELRVFNGVVEGRMAVSIVYIKIDGRLR